MHLHNVTQNITQGPIQTNEVNFTHVVLMTKTHLDCYTDITSVYKAGHVDILY